jgi:hypothetical protein
MMQVPFWPRTFVMRTKRDLLARIHRLQRLVEGLNIELVQISIGCETLMTKEERHG